MKQLSKLVDLYRTNREEFRRIVNYLAVGGWNTLFGMGVYILLYRIFGKEVHYLILTIPANILAVTNAYICYKIFVFKTKGNIIREYLKCYVVYGVSIGLNIAGMFVLVSWLKFYPEVATVLVTGFTVVISYFGHKFFSFRKRTEDESVSE